MAKRYWIRLLFWGLSLLVFEAKTQPLETLLAEAAEQNLELQALHEEYLAALEKAPQVSQLPEPEVGIGLFVLPVETRLGPQWVRVGVTQVFPWKGTRQARADVALAMAKAEYENIAAVQLDLFLQVKRAWYELYELRKSRAILQRNLTLLESIKTMTETKVESGRTSLADVLQNQLKIQELQNHLTQLENAERQPLATLNRLLNRPPDRPILVTDSLQIALLNYNRDSLSAKIRATHPQLGKLVWQQQVAQQQLELNELEGKPSFAVGLDYIMVGKRTDAEPEHNGRDIIMPRVGVKVPIYRKKYTAKAQEEQLKINALQLRQKNTMNAFQTSIEQAYADYEAAIVDLNFYQQQIETLKATLRILRTDYSNDNADFEELLRLQNQLIDYDLKQLKAIVATHLAKARIEQFLR